MKTAIKTGVHRARSALAIGVLIAALGLAAPAFSQQQGQLFATAEAGYARLILSFPGRDNLPTYRLRLENGVLSLEFDEEISVTLPDVGTTLPEYLSIARIDPNRRGLRIALRGTYNFNRIEAGEKLFIDLLSPSWQGLPPALPQDIIDELAERARVAAIRAEQDRKARMVAELDPRANVRIGRNPTFLRLQFDWSVPTTGSFEQEGEQARVQFEWPVDIDLRDLLGDLPAEIVALTTKTTPDGAVVGLELAEGVTPRFYEISPTQYLLDIDIAGQGLPSFDAASLVEATLAPAAAAEPVPAQPNIGMLYPETAATITPFVNVLGSTVRVVFPFAQDTPAAVFKRGDTVWMVFDTAAGIARPAPSSELEALARDFSVLTSGDTQVVRLELSQERLATLGSEGMAWVLSLGDIMLTPTEPVDLVRRRNVEGDFEIAVNMARPGRVHEFQDPQVGDDLRVVTAYPPARGLVRTLDYVDFSALRSVHGLVIKPQRPELELELQNELAIISAPDGLTISALDGPRTSGSGILETLRNSFVDLASLAQPDLHQYGVELQALSGEAAAAEGAQRDLARLKLAQFYLANGFGLEAVGVLKVLEAERQSPELTRKVRLARAIADTMAGRPADALAILNAPSVSKDIDTLVWRAMARTELYDYKGARSDALEAQMVVTSYPTWVQNKFYFAAIRAALETGDANLAERLLNQIDFSTLRGDEPNYYHLFSGHLAQARGKLDEAIDIYGQVIADDVRPTRAEAIYQTMKLLHEAGKLDLPKAIQTLSAETLLWRGNALEADMQGLLTELYFENGDYRLGFETVHQAVTVYPDSPSVNALRDEAQAMFGELFLNGRADTLSPTEALGLFYDFKALTPPGARGDEMIRNLARRLVRVDLLAQAGDLLEYQLDNRLRGVARTQIAADLAVIYLADRRPQDALRVLNSTRLPDIPESLAHQRRLLEARAMLDGGRHQLALDMLRDVAGRDASVLRIDAHWRDKRYAQASELIEALYGDTQEGASLRRAARMHLVKAAVGYVLAGDNFGVMRLRSKFAGAMVTSPEWPLFDLVTSNISVTSVEFKAVAAQVAGMEGINAFLASYRETYGGEGALAPSKASEPSAGLAALD